MKALAREDAIDATAPRRPRRGPERLKIGKETTLMDVRWPRVRDAASAQLFNRSSKSVPSISNTSSWAKMSSHSSVAFSRPSRRAFTLLVTVGMFPGAREFSSASASTIFSNLSTSRPRASFLPSTTAFK
jgi:hypothetical protein